MKENDLINSIFDENIEKNGILKKETEYFNSFSDMQVDAKDTNARIIKFDAVNNELDHLDSKIIKLAAQTSNSTTQLKSKFYISADDRFAIKIVSKNNEYYCSILTNECDPLGEFLVYCEELDDYFVSNIEGQFILTNISGLDLNDLNFSFILPALSVNLYNINNSFHLISEFDSSNFKLLEDDTYVELIFLTAKTFKKIVLANGSLKNFISRNDDRIRINKKLLSNKNTILFY